VADRLHDPVEAGRRLAAGDLGILATDTLPGLHCRADALPALARLRDLKGRETDKPCLLLCADLRDALALAAGPDAAAVAYARRCWPGPFTLVFPSAAVVPDAARGADGGVAIRVPDNEWLAAVVAAAGAPLVSTSVNRSGGPPAPDLASIPAGFAAGVDFVAAPTDADATAPGRPSCLIDLRDRPPRVLRAGILDPPRWRQG